MCGTGTGDGCVWGFVCLSVRVFINMGMDRVGVCLCLNLCMCMFV